MDRREFHRIAHQSDDVSRFSMEGSPARWRLGEFQSRMAAVPHGLIVDPGLQPLRGYPIHIQSLHPDRLFSRVPGCGDGTGSCGEATRQTTLASLVHVLRANDHRIPMRQAKLMTSAFPTGYCARNPPRTRAYVGLIAPSLVGRPVIQFRGNDDRSKRSEIPVIDLLDEGSTESTSRSCPEADNPSMSPLLSSVNRVCSEVHTDALPVTTRQGGMQEVLFTSNGMMQMELLPDRMERATVEDVIPKDLRLRSLNIAREMLNATRAGGYPCEKSMAPSEVINVISDEEDEEGTNAVAEGMEVETGFQSTQTAAMERLQPLLNAIEILSSHEVSEEDVSTSVDGSGMKSLSRRGTRSLNDISQEICKTPRAQEEPPLEERRRVKIDNRRKRRKEENPYRKFYTKRRQRGANDAALWRFLSRGISQEMPQSPVMAPTETIQRLPQIPWDVCQAEEIQRAAWLRKLKPGDLQLLVEHYGLCGLAEILKPNKKT